MHRFPEKKSKRICLQPVHEVLSSYDILPCKAWRPTANDKKITVLADGERRCADPPGSDQFFFWKRTLAPHIRSNVRLWTISQHYRPCLMPRKLPNVHMYIPMHLASRRGALMPSCSVETSLCVGYQPCRQEPQPAGAHGGSHGCSGTLYMHKYCIGVQLGLLQRRHGSHELVAGHA